MAFVRENVPKEYWNLYNLWNLRNTSNEPQIANELKGWFADYEREIFFFSLGGFGGIDIPQPNALMWNNECIIVYILRKTNIDNNTKYLYYCITDITAPQILKNKENEILNLIEEVLNEYIFIILKDKTTKFTIEIKNTINFVEKTKGVRP
jgi:hypothetical protein